METFSYNVFSTNNRAKSMIAPCFTIENKNILIWVNMFLPVYNSAFLESEINIFWLIHNPLLLSRTQPTLNKTSHYRAAINRSFRDYYAWTCDGDFLMDWAMATTISDERAMCTSIFFTTHIYCTCSSQLGVCAYVCVCLGASVVRW